MRGQKQTKDSCYRDAKEVEEHFIKVHFNGLDTFTETHNIPKVRQKLTPTLGPSPNKCWTLQQKPV